MDILAGEAVAVTLGQGLNVVLKGWYPQIVNGYDQKSELEDHAKHRCRSNSSTNKTNDAGEYFPNCYGAGSAMVKKGWNVAGANAISWAPEID